MKNFYSAVLCVLVSVVYTATVVSAFVPPSPLNKCMLTTTTTLQMGYVPDGMTPEQWKKQKEQEQKQRSSKKFGAFGPQTFKSRSFQSFQKDLEKGKTSHLMPVFNAKEKIKKGQLRQEDIPYMQRGGSWDDSDVKGARQKKWSSMDKSYMANEKPAGVDWTGRNQRKGPSSSAASKGKNNNQQKQQQEPKVKKLFGLF
eukprot:CAMPEP_0202453128 /NCGR_PEP_ID=MMETSP1360-20130828/11166_1 /ASSEMBLY_ACC=CAM_ASM_000848 /TAXON_ID=515479 /ORGANISM="Licmophora paradoxa, Strain CCMP2313" /LENGTH=198 /DNA_ID=CAMNT_0049072129 /DNA_START=154 /DNA_END=750 /DNA_ORIENTATION=+